ncbi:MAG: Spy/CpxP family protein refolding chaperone [Burkholderiales bacterium]
MEAPVPANEPSRSRCNHSGHCAPRAGRAIFFLLALVAAGFIGAYASKSFAHGSHPLMVANLDPAQMDENIERMVKHLAVEVDATPPQREKLTSIAQAAARDLAPLRGKMKEARKQALDLMNADNIDRNAIEILRAEQIALLDTVSKRVILALADAAEVLNPDQRRKLAERLQRYGHGRHHGGWHSRG